MNTFAFECTAQVADDQYLLGSPTWPNPIDILRCRLICKAGNSLEPTVFGIEIDGVLTGKTIPIFPDRAGGIVNIVYPVAFKLDAESELRIKCISAPSDPADQIRAVGLNLEAQEASSFIPTPEDLYVWWVDTNESLRIFEYDAGTHLFTESSSGVSTGRAAIDNAATLAITIRGIPVANSNSSQQFKVNEIICNGGTSCTETPRLEFFIGSSRVAALTGTGVLYVFDVIESASVSAGDIVFSFFGGGVLAATLGSLADGPKILTAIECVEPA